MIIHVYKTIMKQSIFIIACFVLIVSCNETKMENAVENKKLTLKTQPVAKDNEQTTPADPSKPLVGTWQLQLDAFDDNGNGLLDPAEREKATPNRMSYHFKPDGTCVIQGIFKGRYELKNENGKENLIVYRERIPQEEEKDPEPEHFRILSLSANELVLLMQESYNENTIWIFKRV